MIASIPSLSPLLLVALTTSRLFHGIHAQDVCACQPAMFTLTLDFSGTCPPNNVSSGPGFVVRDIDCSITNKDDESASADVIPVSVTSYTLYELNNQNYGPIENTEVSDSDLSLEDGDALDLFTSVMAMEDPPTYPGGLQFIVEGVNDAGEELELVMILRYYSTTCDAFAYEVGNSLGWLVFSQLTSPLGEFCPLAAVSEAPSESPSSSPVKETEPPVASPSTSPTIVTADPTPAPVTGTESPVTLTSTSPTIVTAEPTPAPVTGTESPVTLTSTSPTIVTAEPTPVPVIESEAPVASPSTSPTVSPINVDMTSSPVMDVDESSKSGKGSKSSKSSKSEKGSKSSKSSKVSKGGSPPPSKSSKSTGKREATQDDKMRAKSHVRRTHFRR